MTEPLTVALNAVARLALAALLYLAGYGLLSVAIPAAVAVGDKVLDAVCERAAKRLRRAS